MPTRRPRPSTVPLVTTVPDLLGRKVDAVDELTDAAGVIVNLSYRPRARQAAGTVVAVHPAAGSAVVRGSAVRVSVAGRPAAEPARPASAEQAGRPGTGPGRRRHARSTSHAELENVRAGVTAEVLRAAGITVRVDPAAGAVRVEGDLPAEVAAVLTATYGAQLVMSRPAKRAHAADRNTTM
jgi:hypothetical protein